MSKEPNTLIDLTEAAQAVAAVERQELDGHPEPEDLVAYQERRLDKGDADPIAEHLALCPPCARLVLDLAAFPDLSLQDETLALDPDQRAADLHALLKQLPEEKGESGQHRSSGRNRPHLLLAASIVGATLGLGLWLTGVPSPLKQHSEDIVPGTLLDLYPVSASRRGPTAEQSQVSIGEGPVALVLNSTVEATRFAHFEVEIYSDGVEWLVGQTLFPDDQGTFTLVVAGSLLPPGPIEILLWGTSSERERFELARYRMEIRYTDGS